MGNTSVLCFSGKGTKNFENAEDPIEVLAKDLPIDFDYYINKQLKPPLIRIFELILPNPEAVFNGAHTMKRYVPKVSSTSALGKFVIKKKFCLSCKGVVEDGGPLCCACTSKAMEIITLKTMVLTNPLFV